MMPNEEEIEAAIAKYRRERDNARQREYRARNRDTVNAKQREYRARNRERVNAYKRAYYARKKAEKSHLGAATPSVAREKSTNKV